MIKKILVSLKGVDPSGTMSQILDSENFSMAIRSCCQQKIILLTTLWTVPRRSWTVDIIHSLRTVYYTSVDHDALTPLLRSVVDLLHYLFLQLCSISQNFDRRSASLTPSAVAKLFLILIIFIHRNTVAAINKQKQPIGLYTLSPPSKKRLFF